jgi:hypothetical protein
MQAEGLQVGAGTSTILVCSRNNLLEVWSTACRAMHTGPCTWAQLCSQAHRGVQSVCRTCPGDVLVSALVGPSYCTAVCDRPSHQLAHDLGSGVQALDVSHAVPCCVVSCRCLHHT